MALRPRPASSQWGRAFDVALQFAGAVLIGMLAGWYLDSWLGTEPWLLLVFLALGFTAGIRNLLRFQARALREQAKAESGDES